MLRSMLFMTCAAALSVSGAHAANVDFEDVAAPSTFVVGDTFTSGGVVASHQDFTFSSGTLFSGGFSQVQANLSPLSGGSGQELQINNILVDFAITPTSELSLNFGEFGGNLNIIVNGVFQNFGNFSDINMTNIGGADVSVTNGFGNDSGILTLTGGIFDFAIGGQELWIDNLNSAPAVPVPASALLLAGGLGVLLRFRKSQGA